MSQKVIIFIIVTVLIIGGIVYFSFLKAPSVLKQTSSIIVLSPNGGEKWEVGKEYGIHWQMPTDLPGGTMIISLIQSDSKKEKVLFSDLAIDVPTNYGVNWTIPDDVSPGSYIISIVALINAQTLEEDEAYKIGDVSDAPFSIITSKDETPN